MIDNEINSHGTMKELDGGNYVGKWIDGKSHGMGIETFHDGRKHDGEFKDGDIWNGKEYDEHVKIKGRYVNGKEIDQ